MKNDNYIYGNDRKKYPYYIISDNAAKLIKKKYNAHHDAFIKLGRNYYTSEDNLPPYPGHSRIGALETWEFINDPPDKYFSYVKRDAGIMQTWNGFPLGKILTGNAYYSNFGDRRIPISVHAINGLWYHGTFYASAGDYCRIKKSKYRPNGELQ